MKGFLKFMTLSAASVLVFVAVFEAMLVLLETYGKKHVTFRDIF